MKVKDLNSFDLNELEEIVILSKLIKDSECMFKIKPFKHMKYGQVLELKNYLRADKNIDTELIKNVSLFSGCKISDKDLKNSNLKKFFYTINIIENEFKKIYSYEKLLIGNRDSELENAGANQLEQFGDLNVIDSLAGGDILKWGKVLELEWWDVYNKLLKDKTERDVQRRYAEIQKAKSK